MQSSQNSGHSFQILSPFLEKGDKRVWPVRLTLYMHTTQVQEAHAGETVYTSALLRFSDWLSKTFEFHSTHAHTFRFKPVR